MYPTTTKQKNLSNNAAEWFNEIWGDERLVEDVKDAVLRYQERLYHNYSAQFVYYKTLYYIFETYLATQDSSTTNQQQQLAHTHIWNKLFAFQQDGVKAAIAKTRYVPTMVVS